MRRGFAPPAGAGGFRACGRGRVSRLRAQMPIDPALTKLVDEGKIEEMTSDALEGVVDVLCAE